MKNNYKQKLLKYQNNIISDYMLINMKAQKNGYISTKL